MVLHIALSEVKDVPVALGRKLSPVGKRKMPLCCDKV